MLVKGCVGGVSKIFFWISEEGVLFSICGIVLVFWLCLRMKILFGLMFFCCVVDFVVYIVLFVVLWFNVMGFVFIFNVCFKVCFL